MTMIRGLFCGLALCAALLLLLGFAGPWSRPADTLSILRPALAALCCILCVAPRQNLWKAVLACVGLLGLVTSFSHSLPQTQGEDIRIYSKNLLAGNTTTIPLVQDILSANVDAVFLQEVSDQNQNILTQLADQFPYQHLCNFSPWSRISIVSKHPFTGPKHCSFHRALAAAQITLDDTPVWLVSAHIAWPWPKNTQASVAKALELLEGLQGPIVLAGDFNMMPWSHRIAQFRAASRTQLAGPVQPSYHLGNVPLAIDMAMAPAGGRLTRRPKLGSDHHGIIADLSLGLR